MPTEITYPQPIPLGEQIAAVQSMIDSINRSERSQDGTWDTDDAAQTVARLEAAKATLERLTN